MPDLEVEPQTSSKRASAELRGSILALKELGGGQVAINAAIARNVMREELGDYGDYDGAKYRLTQETRDVLLVHGRQDAANAMINASSAMKGQVLLRRLLILNTILLVGMIAYLLWQGF